jgi:PAS domain S-box-containing protein
MKAVTREERRVAYPLVWVFCLRAAGIVTAGMGLLTLLGWVLKLPLLASFGKDLIPMAPSTAVLFLLYGAAVCLRARSPLSQRAFRFSVALVGLGTMVALLLFTLGCLNIHLEIEHPGLPITHTVGKALIGHMSPVTAFGFLLASLSFLASLSTSTTRLWRILLAFGAEGLLAGTSFIFLLAYIYGAPLLYGGTFLPPALNSVLTFVILGLALMALAGRMTGLFGGLPGEGSRTAIAFALIFILLAAGIVTVGYRSYRNYERNYYSAAGRQLAAIADLKVNELVEWRKERLADGAIMFKNSAFTALVRRFFEQPEDADAQRQLRVWIDKYRVDGGYDRIRLLDTQCLPRMSSPAGNLPPMSSTIQKNLPEILRSGRVTFQDFYRNNYDQRVYLTVMTPVVDESDTNHPLGVFDLRIDPETYLYPFIKRWPVPSETAETLLVRRDGNDALFLNELKFHANAALNLRVSLEKTNNPAVKAVLGQEGIVEGVDYRGDPVLAALKAVPDSPWFLVARMNTAEVFAPMRNHLWQMVVMICVLLLGSAAGVGLVWRQQRARFYRAQYESAEALRRAETKFHTLYDSTRDAVMLLDTKGFFDCNPATLAVFGCVTREEFCSKHPADVSPPMQPDGTDSLTLANQRIATALEKGGNQFEWMHKRINTGETFPAEVLLSAMELDGKPVLQAVVRDITRRKRAEDALQASEARFRTLIERSPVAISISRAGRTIYVSQKFLDLYGFQSVDELVGQPVADQWAPEFREPIMERAQRRARGEPVPLEYEGMGLRKDGSQFPVHINVALVELPDGPAFMAFLTNITERKRAEEKLRQLSRAVEQSPASIVITNPAGDIEYANPKFVEVTGYTLAEALGKNPRILKSGEKGPEAYRELWETIAAGQEWRGEFHNKKKNGELYWESASISPIRDPAGRVTHFVAVKEDITARKQTEAERDKLIQDLQEALANVKSLSGLLPICSGCKKIRDDKGYWSQVDSYIQKHSDATFTHSLCPDCIKKWYPELAKDGLDDSSKKTT